MKFISCRLAWHAAIAGFGLLAAGAAAAQACPSNTIRIVIPYAAGGGTDVMARVMEGPLARALGQPVIIENRPGGSGVLATRMVAKGSLDGCTLLFANNGPHTVLPSLMKDIGYEGVRDFAPVAWVATMPMVLAVNSALPVSSTEEFLSYARTAKTLEYATSGVGSMSHLAVELFLSQAKLNALQIPYGGQAPTLVALVTGDVKFNIMAQSSLLNEYVKKGSVKLLGVTTKVASPLLPEVPPIARALPGFSIELWFALLVPEKTPRPIVERLAKAVNTAMQDAAVVEGVRSIGALPTPGTPAELAAVMTAEKNKFAVVIREKGIKAD